MPPAETPEKEARKALNRLRRSLEKCEREMDALESAIHRAEGDDFPERDYAEARSGVAALIQFLELEERRLRDKILAGGGLEPGRLRRTSAMD